MTTVPKQSRDTRDKGTTVFIQQLDGADIVLGVEMQSTGEAACFGTSFYDALSDSASVGYHLPHCMSLKTYGSKACIASPVDCI